MNTRISIDHISQQLLQHVRFLGETVGSRPIGTPANHRAEQYITQQFEQWGFAIRRQPFACPPWTWQSGRLMRGSERACAFTLNPFTRGCDVEAPLVPIGNMADLEAVDISGQIVLLYGDLARERYTPRAFTLFRHERHHRILQLLESRQPAAVLLVNPQVGRDKALPLMGDWLFPVPSATVTPEVALKLVHAHGPIQLQMDTSIRPFESANILARYQPRGTHSTSTSSPARVAVSAHFDTHFGAPGVIDNATGVAVLLVLAEMAAHGDLGTEWTRPIDFIAFNGEEYAALGDQVYLQSQPDFDNIIAAVNLDGVGLALGNTTITTMGCSTALDEAIHQATSPHAALQWVEPWYESNHTTFLMQGVPAIALSSRGVQGLADSPDDTMDWLSVPRTVGALDVLRTVLEPLRQLDPQRSRQRDS
ncbi:MAG: M28 family peptidase [Thermaerobacter sp.]|nr:M28 family peptidase [Thermaerobacter sp.]